MKTIQELANEYSNMFETKTRTNGDKFLCVKDKHDQEQWNHTPLARMIHSCHHDMLPDDYKYQFIVEALDAIADSSDIDTIQIEPDVYNHELLKWVTSHGARQGYCDQIIEEYGLEHTTFMNIISCAQYTEKEEVLQNVKEFLKDIVEQLNNG